MDPFDEIVADFGEVDIPTEHHFEQWDKVRLLEEHRRVKETLLAHNAILDPQTDEDKDLQGFYFGLVAEMRRRRFL